MKNYEYWKSFVSTGRIDDYLNYIACTREETLDDLPRNVENSMGGMERYKEGGAVAGINYRDGNGPVSHANW